MLLYPGEYAVVLCLFLVFLLFGEFYWSSSIGFRFLLFSAFPLSILAFALPIERFVAFALAVAIFCTLLVVFSYKGTYHFRRRYAAYLRCKNEEGAIVKKYKSIYDFHLKKLQESPYRSPTTLLHQAVEATQAEARKPKEIAQETEEDNPLLPFQDPPETFDALLHDLSLGYCFKDQITLYLRTVSLDVLIEMVRFQLKDKVPIAFQIHLDKEGLVPKSIACDFEKLSQLIAYVIENQAMRSNVPVASVYVLLAYAQLLYTASGVHGSKATPAWAMAIACATEPISRSAAVAEYYQGSDPPQWIQTLEAASNAPLEAEIQALANVQCGCFASPSLVVVPLDLEKIRSQMRSDLSRAWHATRNGGLQGQATEERLDPLEKFHAALHLYTSDPELHASYLLAVLKYLYGNQKHPSGRFRYLRILGVAQSAAKAFPNIPIILYVVLLHDLMQHTPISMAFLRANYGLHLTLLLEKRKNLDKRKGLEADALKVGDRSKRLFLPQEGDLWLLAFLERLYDLKSWATYKDKPFLERMAHETLVLDLPILTKHLPALRSSWDTPTQMVVQQLEHQLAKTAKMALDFAKIPQ